MPEPIQLRPGAGLSFDGGGGGGHDEGMEARLNEVEKAIIRIDGRFDRMGDTLDNISTSVSQWKWQLLAATVTILLAAVATMLTVQQMSVSTFQAAVQAAPAQAPREPVTINVLPSAPQPSERPASR